jgi:hypothetical protein
VKDLNKSFIHQGKTIHFFRLCCPFNRAKPFIFSGHTAHLAGPNHSFREPKIHSFSDDNSFIEQSQTVHLARSKPFIKHKAIQLLNKVNPFFSQGHTGYSVLLSHFCSKTTHWAQTNHPFCKVIPLILQDQSVYHKHQNNQLARIWTIHPTRPNHSFSQVIVFI